MVDPQLRELLHHGQSVWLDQLTRDWIEDGTLASLAEAGIRGVTSNPTIFASAIAGSRRYAQPARAMASRGRSAEEIYDALTVHDIRAACDLFRPLYDSTEGRDGFVSHEVSPLLARDHWATLHEARRLWSEVDRPNVMIKIPATREGMPAVEAAIAEGINVNVTLLFTMSQYDDVVEAFLSGLESRLAKGLAVERVASVASFFVSRVDTRVDAALEARLDHLPSDAPEAAEARRLKGRAAVANASRAYARFLASFAGERWAGLAARGARPQRVLWASTSTKDPAYSDVKYVAELVANDTVNTLPLSTLAAVRDHGRVDRVLDGTTSDDDQSVAALTALGVDLESLGWSLLEDGLAAFASSYREALQVVDERRQQLASEG